MEDVHGVALGAQLEGMFERARLLQQQLSSPHTRAFERAAVDEEMAMILGRLKALRVLQDSEAVERVEKKLETKRTAPTPEQEVHSMIKHLSTRLNSEVPAQKAAGGALASPRLLRCGGVSTGKRMSPPYTPNRQALSRADKQHTHHHSPAALPSPPTTISTLRTAATLSTHLLQQPSSSISNEASRSNPPEAANLTNGPPTTLINYRSRLLLHH